MCAWYLSPLRRVTAVQAQGLQTLPRHTDDLGELRALLARYRWRLGAELVCRFVARGVIVGGLLLVLASGLTWLLELSVQPFVSWLALFVPPLTAVALALANWPSHAQTARTADRRLRLNERLGTAVELTSRPHDAVTGRFDRLQVRDAIERARVAPRTWSARGQLSRRELALALLVSLLSASSLLLPLLPRPSFQPAAELPSVSDSAGMSEDRVVPPDVQDISSVGAASVQEQPADADLATRVRAAQAQHQSLDRLAQALGEVSASQGAADAIQRGDFAEARNQLNSLAEEADQLSDDAKKQLARALSSAASTAGADRQLADREKQAAQALGRSNYVDQRQALRQLADQVERSGARTQSQSQMARDVGRLQQQASGNGQGQSPSSAGAPSTGVQAQQGVGAAGGQSPGGADAGEQGGVGAGTGSTDGVGAPAGRLATSGQLVEVPTKLSAGPGERPSNGSEDQVGANPGMGGSNVAEAARTQQTGQLTPERNLVPSEQRPVVRGYFR
jgi:hypothetical protein